MQIDQVVSSLHTHTREGESCVNMRGVRKKWGSDRHTQAHEQQQHQHGAVATSASLVQRSEGNGGTQHKIFRIIRDTLTARC